MPILQPSSSKFGVPKFAGFNQPRPVELQQLLGDSSDGRDRHDACTAAIPAEMLGPKIAARMKQSDSAAGDVVPTVDLSLFERITPRARQTQIIEFIRAAARRRDHMIHNTGLAGLRFRGVAILATPFGSACHLSSHLSRWATHARRFCAVARRSMISSPSASSSSNSCRSSLVNLPLEFFAASVSSRCCLALESR